MGRRIRGVSFDLDDTLWETGPVIARAEQLSLDWLTEHAPEAVAGRDPDSLLAHRRAYYATQPQHAHDFTALRKGWFRQLFAEAGLPEGLAEAAFEAFWVERNAVQPFPEAMAVVIALGDDLTLGTITNGNACVHHIGIGHHFDFVVTAADAGAAKPHAQIFRHAADLAGLEAAELVHVGDDPVTDVGGARDFGMRTVWVNAGAGAWNPDHGAPPDAEVASVAEIMPIIAAWR